MRMRSQVQDDPSQIYHMLEACHPYGVDGYAKILLNEAFP